MQRLLLAVLVASFSCSGYYATLTAEEKDHFHVMREGIVELAAVAVLESERASDAAKRAERAATRARGSEVEPSEECLKKALASSRSAASGANSIVRVATRGLPLHYPSRVKLYQAAETVLEGIRATADYAEAAADCKPQWEPKEPPELPPIL